MYDFSSIQKAKSNVLEKRVENSVSSYDKALISIQDFNKSKNIEILRKATNDIIESINHNNENPNSYFLLGYIFYILDNDEFALKYIKKGQSLIDNIPEEIEIFKKDLEKNISYLNMKEELNKNIQNFQQAKIVVPKKSSFWKLLSGK